MYHPQTGTFASVASTRVKLWDARTGGFGSLSDRAATPLVAGTDRILLGGVERQEAGNRVAVRARVGGGTEKQVGIVLTFQSYRSSFGE